MSNLSMSSIGPGESYHQRKQTGTCHCCGQPIYQEPPQIPHMAMIMDAERHMPSDELAALNRAYR